MDSRQMFLSMLDCNKRAFEHTFNAMAMAQDHCESMLDIVISQASLLPNEGEKVSNEWINGLKKGREAYYKASQDGFNKLEEFLLIVSNDISKQP